MANTIAAAEVEFHSEKNCFILLDSHVLGAVDSDELRFFEIRKSDDETNNRSIYVAGHTFRSNSRQRSDSKSRLIINGVFANCLGIKVGEQVLVTLLKEPKECLSVVAEPVSSDDWEVVLLNAEKIEEQLLVQLRLVYVGMEFPIWIDGGYCLFLRLVSCESSGASYALLADDTEVTVAPKVSIKDSKRSNKDGNIDQSISSDSAIDQIDPSTFVSLRGITFFDAILDRLHRYASAVLSKTDSIFIGQPLIIGTAGSGKTTMAKSFCLEMRNRRLASYTCIVECKLLKGKAVESVEKRLKEKISNAADSQPALIVLDDLDCLCGACSTMEQITPGMAMVYERMSRMLANLLNEIRRKRQRILFVATSTSTSTLNPFLVSPRGLRFFDYAAEIPELDFEARRAIVGRLVESGTSAEKCPRNVSTWVAKRTDGYVMADLAALVERAWIDFENEQGIGTDSCPNVANFKSALDDFISVALSGAGKNSTETKKDAVISFDNIGGLLDAKAVLEKVLFLPTKYPQVFSTLPIRLPRGILLYGPSGCGKTMLAAAVAKDYKLNLIHVKGAELLSKYIGASEQSVRDTFVRAKSMKPCLVFFDEFDALAPRRGHDSTGVTDRVVNQLLTEMDGVEGLEGVFVCAASSRPDLIDPALLRPGRIDKRVYCGMPSEADRLDILIRISKPLLLDPDVDFGIVAKKTDAFSGADLKTILLDAHLLALRERDPKQKTETMDAVRITQAHLLQVLDSTKASVSDKDRRRFEKMYEGFRNDLDEKALTKFYQDNVGKRATLA